MESMKNQIKLLVVLFLSAATYQHATHTKDELKSFKYILALNIPFHHLLSPISEDQIRKLYAEVDKDICEKFIKLRNQESFAIVRKSIVNYLEMRNAYKRPLN